MLPRVQALSGLFLLKLLPDDCLDKFQVPQNLNCVEGEMYAFEKAVLDARDRNMRALKDSYKRVD